MKDHYDKVKAICDGIKEAINECCDYLMENRIHFGDMSAGNNPDFKINLLVGNQDREDWVGTVAYTAVLNGKETMEYFKTKEIDKKSNKKSENDV